MKLSKKAQAISAILAKHDHEGLIRMGAPADEYSFEAEEIAKYAAGCSVMGIAELLYDVYERAFYGGRGRAPEEYNLRLFVPAAREIFALQEQP